MTTTTTQPDWVADLVSRSEGREQKIPTVRSMIEFRHDGTVLCALDSDTTAIHVPAVGDSVDLYRVPVTVTAVTLAYDTDDRGNGISFAIVEVQQADRVPAQLIV